MIAEQGHCALMRALGLALIQGAIAFIGAPRPAKTAAALQAGE